MRLAITFFFLIITIRMITPAAAEVQITRMISGLDQPWGIALLPDASVLITEKEGRLLHVRGGKVHEIGGLPKVTDRGQGGLLDITLPRDFETSREVFLTYSKPQRSGSGTALAIARLPENASQLVDLRDIFVMAPGSSGGRHFGSRVVEANDGTLYLTIGDRGNRPAAQDRSVHNGSIVRVNRDGSVPSDNPFVGQPSVLPEIWSFGHRNPQGAGLDAQGRLWTSEHGARGGDEVNFIRKGANFGWPVISYGRHYSGAKIGEGTRKPGLEQPAHYWDPSIAPSGLLVYQGAMFPEWRSDIFVGSLKFDYIARLEVNGTQAAEVAQIKTQATDRVRDVIEAPDGSIWFVSVGNGAVYRMSRG